MLYLLAIVFLIGIFWTYGSDLSEVSNSQDQIQENGVLILRDVEHISNILHGDENTLLLAILYSKKCANSYDLILKLEEVAETLAWTFGTDETDHNLKDLELSMPRVAKLDGDGVDPSWVETLGVVSYPTLLFFRQVYQETIVMDYLGLQNNSIDIVETIMHYWYRFTLGPVFPASSVHDVKEYIEKNGSKMFKNVSPAWNPDYTMEEKEIISWLMSGDEDELDPYMLLLQCQIGEKEQSLYQSFFDLAKSIATQRNVMLFSVTEDCTGIGNDSDVTVFSVSPETFQIRTPAQKKPHKMPLHQFAVQMTSPSVLFYDRFSIGPIAFPVYRRLHAVLFVQLSKENATSRDAIRSFRQVCQQHRMKENAILTDMVCLVVPETETRILTYFGVDIWTPLDTKLSQGKATPLLLPVLLITDQRKEETFMRYYLEAGDLLEDITSSVPVFFQDFWMGRLLPDIKSSTKAVHINHQGVETITGLSFKKVVMERKSNHTLLYLFAPTCGHCKRFSILWNELAQLIRAVEWNIDVLRMDVTENEILDSRISIDPAFVPAVYYFPLGSKEKATAFEFEDKFGDTVGRLHNPFDIIDWMFSIGNFDEEKMFEKVEKLKGFNKKKEGYTCSADGNTYDTNEE